MQMKDTPVIRDFLSYNRLSLFFKPLIRHWTQPYSQKQ